MVYSVKTRIMGSTPIIITAASFLTVTEDRGRHVDFGPAKVTPRLSRPQPVTSRMTHPGRVNPERRQAVHECQPGQ